MTLTPAQIKAAADQLVHYVVKHGGELVNRDTGAIRFPSKEAKAAFEAEYYGAPSVL